MTEKAKDKGKTLLLHRRGRIDNRQTEFPSEKEARKYAEDERLLIVHEDHDEEGHLRLYYLPE